MHQLTKLMKRLLLPLLAALALPTAINANTWDDMSFKRRWPVFINNYNNGVKFQEIEDFEMTCSSFIKANNELTNYFTLFQRYKPDIDFFEIRAGLKPIIRQCNDASIYY